MKELRPDAVFYSNGPGDPAALPYVVDSAKEFVGKLPFFGICLGHQILGQALGAETFKLKFGHRGGNHPVQDTRSGKVSITAQNHGFYVQGETLPASTDWEVALVNLNDGSVEGLRHATLPIISVQFHPEASPGPWDSGNLFDDFLDMVRARKAA